MMPAKACLLEKVRDAVSRIGAFDVALALAVEGSKHCNRKVELRPFLEG